ncbi:MAG: hypothetical protein VZR24_04045 [Butyrivibrio hungatei]|nr:hypothetical protein [Butyrivibrio hungatei]
MIKDSRENEVVMSSEEFDVEIEGYAYCESKKNQCLNDCVWGIGGKASAVDIH